MSTLVADADTFNILDEALGDSFICLWERVEFGLVVNMHGSTVVAFKMCRWRIREV